jgi:hypothetical protein
VRAQGKALGDAVVRAGLGGHWGAARGGKRTSASRRGAANGRWAGWQGRLVRLARGQGTAPDPKRPAAGASGLHGAAPSGSPRCLLAAPG